MPILRNQNVCCDSLDLGEQVQCDQLAGCTCAPGTQTKCAAGTRCVVLLPPFSAACLQIQPASWCDALTGVLQGRQASHHVAASSMLTVEPCRCVPKHRVCQLFLNVWECGGTHAIAAAWQLPTPGVTPPGRSNVAALAFLRLLHVVWVVRTCATYVWTNHCHGLQRCLLLRMLCYRVDVVWVLCRPLHAAYGVQAHAATVCRAWRVACRPEG